MITNLGKNVVTKYLIGQAPAYASHIAVGCGAQPLSTALDLEDYSNKLALDFEMFRVPVTSRGYIKENGIVKVVFTAELPTQERYEITELGLYSAGANPSATGFDSRTLYTFSRQESWKTAEVSGSEELRSNMYVIDAPLSSNPATGDMVDINTVADDGVDHKTFQTNATNRLFSDINRRDRSEQLRYLNNMIMMRGNYSSLSGSGSIDINSSYIYLPTSVSLQNNSSSDTVKLAFSVVSVINAAPEPASVRIMLRFEDSVGRAAQVEYVTEAGKDWSNRYTILEKPISDFAIDSGFLWSRVSEVKIFGVVLDNSGTPSPGYYIALDAIRLENLTSQNPLYGMTAYSPLITDDGRPVVKLPNTGSLIEFRLGIGI